MAAQSTQSSAEKGARLADSQADGTQPTILQSSTCCGSKPLMKFRLSFVSIWDLTVRLRTCTCTSNQRHANARARKATRVLLLVYKTTRENLSERGPRAQSPGPAEARPYPKMTLAEPPRDKLFTEALSLKLKFTARQSMLRVITRCLVSCYALPMRSKSAQAVHIRATTTSRHTPSASMFVCHCNMFLFALRP